MDEETKDRLDKLENMMMHIHSHTEIIIRDISVMERKMISSGNWDMYTQLKETFEKLENGFDRGINGDGYDHIAEMEIYTPINEKDDEINDERLLEIRGWVRHGNYVTERDENGVDTTIPAYGCEEDILSDDIDNGNFEYVHDKDR